MTWRPLLVAALVMTSIMAGNVAMAQPADEWDDDCSTAPVVDPTGTYAGAIDSPDDYDSFKIELEKGEYVALTWALPEEEGNFAVVHHAKADEYGSGDLSIEGVSSQGGNNYVTDVSAGTTSYEVWSEEPEPQTICISVSDAVGSDAEVPYQWKLSMEKNAPEPPEMTVGESDNSEELAEKEERIEELKAENEDLQSTLEQREDRIEELESEVDELEAQLESDDRVIFDIEVTPSNGEQFAVGEYAVVNVDGQNVDPDELHVGHGETVHELEDGQTMIHLDESGEQSIIFAYDDKREFVDIHVEENDPDLTLIGKAAAAVVFGIAIAIETGKWILAS